MCAVDTACGLVMGSYAYLCVLLVGRIGDRFVDETVFLVGHW